MWGWFCMPGVGFFWKWVFLYGQLNTNGEGLCSEGLLQTRNDGALICAIVVIIGSRRVSLPTYLWREARTKLKL